MLIWSTYVHRVSENLVNTVGNQFVVHLKHITYVNSFMMTHKLDDVLTQLLLCSIVCCIIVNAVESYHSINPFIINKQTGAHVRLCAIELCVV